jgi:pyrroloquinoline quinone biosynthesis protein D
MTPASRPRLAPKARLRRDRRGGWLLLYPERGLALSPTAAEVVRRCTGERTVAAITAELAAASGAPADVVQRDVLAFLHALAARALVRDGA